MAQAISQKVRPFALAFAPVSSTLVAELLGFRPGSFATRFPVPGAMSSILDSLRYKPDEDLTG